MAAAEQQDGVLKVLTFTGTQPFVVRCERDTRVRDIVSAIAEIWGFKEAARLFTLCHPAPGSDLSDPTKLLPGALLSWTDRPCQVAASAVIPDQSSQASTPRSATGTIQQPPPLLLVRYIFGSTAAELDQNHSVLSLTAAQIAADVAASRYPGVAEAGLYQHWVKQGQHSVVLHMAASWPSGGCLIVGPAQVINGGAALQLSNASINLGLNSKGMHIMMPQQHKMLLPLDSIASVTADEDVLSICFVSSQPDLLLQIPGAEAVAEAFMVHKDAAEPKAPALQPSSVSSAAGSSAAPLNNGKPGGPHMPQWITSPSVERWLQEPTPEGDAQQLSVSTQVLRLWEQTPPVLRATLTTEQPPQDDRAVEAQLLVVDDDEDTDTDVNAATDVDTALSLGSSTEDTATASEQKPKQKQQSVRLQLTVLQQPAEPLEPRVRLTITPVSLEEQEALKPTLGEEPLVRLVIKTRDQMGAAPGAMDVLRMLQKGSGAQAPPGVLAGAEDGIMLRSMGLGGPAGAAAAAADQAHPQLMQRLQHQQQQEVRQGLMAGTHLGGATQPGFVPLIRPMYGNRPFGATYRPGMPQQQQQQSGAWGGQQFPSNMARPAGMRPMGPVIPAALPHQPYALAGPPNTLPGGQPQMPQRPSMGPMQGGMQGGFQSMQQPRGMRPQQQHYQHHQQQQFQQQQFQQQQPQFAAMRQPQQPQQQQQMVMQQQGGYMVMQQPQQQMQQGMMQQQQPHMGYSTMPQQQQMQQQQPQQVMMLQSNTNTAGAGGKLVLVTTADGRQMLVQEGQLQQQQANNQAVMPGVFMLGAHGELVPASQPVATNPGAGMQQMALQHQQQQPQQMMVGMQQQNQVQPMFVQQTPSQKMQQQHQVQQSPQMQFQQQQQQAQVTGMAGLGSTGQYNQLNAMNMGQQQPQQQLMQQAQPMSFMDLNTGQLHMQAQPQQQQQFVSVSSAQAGGQVAQLLQLQGMAGTSAAMGTGQPGFVLQGQQQQQQQQQALQQQQQALQQQQLLMPNAGQQQQQVLLQTGTGLVDSNNMGMLQQQMQPRHSNGSNMVMSGGVMFGQTGTGANNLVNPSGPASGGGLQGLALLQQGMAGQGMAGQGMTNQGMTGQGLGAQGMSGQGMGPQVMAGQGMGAQGMTGQGLAGQGMTGQGMAGQGMAGQGMAGQGMSNQGMTGQGLTAQGMAGQGMAGQSPGLAGITNSAAPGLSTLGLGDTSLNTSLNPSLQGSGMGMGGMGNLGSVGGVAGLGAPGSSYLNGFDAIRQPNSQNLGLGVNNTGLAVGGVGGAGQTPMSADPPGLNYGSVGQKTGGFLQQAQQQQPQQQMFSLGGAGMGGIGGLGVQDGLQGGLQQGGLHGGLQQGGLQQGGLQGGVLTSDGFMLGGDGGMTLTGAAPGLDASAFGATQQFNPPGFY